MKNFAIYNASAGSGKTFTLVKEYLKIALKNDSPTNYQSILAITFTNKAASEMKERVLGALKAFSGLEELEGTSKALLDVLVDPIEGLGDSPGVIEARSEKVLKSILHNYTSFAIGTIDKFTHKVVRTFAHDLHLPLNFDIEMDRQELLDRSVDLLFNQVGVDEKSTKLLVEYAKAKSDDEKSWQVERDVKSFAQEILKDDAEEYLKKLRGLTLEQFAEVKKEIARDKKAFEEKLVDFGEEMLDKLKGKGVESKSFSRGSFPTFCKKLVNNVVDPFPSTTLQKSLKGEVDFYAKSVAQPQKDLIDEIAEDIYSWYQQFEEFLKENYSKYVLGDLVSKNIYNIALLSEIEQNVNEYKQENGVLDFTDFNKKIASVIERESVPFIYERLGERYKHYLIDEFQDTSILQWHNLIPLVENALSESEFSMVVGDAKQAIYRFRGGEVEQLIKLPNIYKKGQNRYLQEREQIFKRNVDKRDLRSNYRSKKEIVDFNNAFFDFVSNKLPEDYQPLYKGLNQLPQEGNVGGNVQIKFLEKGKKEEVEPRMIAEVLTQVQDLKEEGFRLNEIAILTRGKDDGALIAANLLEIGIPVVSSESLLLNNSAEVKFLVGFLRCLAFPKNKSFQLPVVDYLISKNNSSKSLIDSYNYKNINSLSDYLISICFDLKQDFNQQYSLYELAELLIKKFNLEKEVNIFLQFFLDKLQDYVVKHDNSIVNFLDWWERKSSAFSVVIPEGLDAVQIMTIHKSKGLEFPVVIYPFASGNVNLKDEKVWLDDAEYLSAALIDVKKSMLDTDMDGNYNEVEGKVMLDLVNVLYVALTRPEKRLSIISNEPFKGGGVMSTYKLLQDFCNSGLMTEQETGVYCFGERAKVQDRKEVQSQNELLNGVGYNNWRDRIKVSLQAPAIWDVDSPKTFTDYGKMIHKILSEVEEVDDFSEVISRYFMEGILSENEKEELNLLFEELIGVDGFNDLFLSVLEVRNECSILLPSGKSYTPDKVVRKQGKTIVVDYKTGDKEKKHLDQITNYKKLLIEMGEQNIEACLFYIKSKEFVYC